MVAGILTKRELGFFSPSQQFAFLFHELVWKGDFIWFCFGEAFLFVYFVCFLGFVVGVGALVCWFVVVGFVVVFCGFGVFLWVFVLFVGVFFIFLVFCCSC